MDDTRFCLKRFNSKFGLLAKKSKKKNEKKKKTTATKRDGDDGARDAPLEVKKKRERVFADDVVEGAVPADFESGKKRRLTQVPRPLRTRCTSDWTRYIITGGQRPLPARPHKDRGQGAFPRLRACPLFTLPQPQTWRRASL